MIVFSEQTHSNVIDWKTKRFPVYRILDNEQWMENFFSTGEIQLSSLKKFKGYKDEMQGDEKEGDFAVDFHTEGFVNFLMYESGLNAYKHGFRIFPAWKKFILADKETLEPKVEMNLENSLSLLEYDHKKKKTVGITVTLDTERDMKMTNVVSDLIGSIIGLRKYYFNELKGPIELTDFSKLDLENYSKYNVDVPFIEFTAEPEQSKNK